MEDPFQKQGIEFKIIDEKMIPQVTDFLWTHFYPHEPISRSLKIRRTWALDELHLKDAMKDGSSMAALNSKGEVIGARIGKRKRKSQWMVKMFDRSFFLLPNWMIKRLGGSEGMPIFLKIIKLVGFDTWKMFDELDCEQIYEDAAVCSDRGSGVRGIGTELCRRTEILAKELGCSHTYAAVTG